MGISEWGVRSQAEGRRVVAALAEQNRLAAQQAAMSDEELSRVQDVSAERPWGPGGQQRLRRWQRWQRWRRRGDALMMATAPATPRPLTSLPQVGCDLRVGAVLRFRGHFWVCMQNDGGANSTTAFLRERLAGATILWPFAKPDGWYDCNDYA